ncbi:MAG: hypothetical protein Q9M13_05135 [Mariprofundales bacterium]|nr:hypothetical protein [Mariprofundales bacterium]
MTDCTQIQQRLQQAILHKEWQYATTLINEYISCIDRIKQRSQTTPVSLTLLRQYEAHNRQMVQQLRLTMQHTQDDIDDITRTIARLERSKLLLADSQTSKQA